MNTQPSYFQSYPDPFYEDWKTEPVPGWGARPVMAGPRMVAVGNAFGDTCITDPRTGKTECSKLVVPVPKKYGTGLELPEDAKPFYKQAWFIPAAALGVAGLAMVAYFATRK